MREKCQELFTKHGLTLIGFADLKEEPFYPKFESWLNEGKNAGMVFLNRNRNLRQFPHLLLEGSVQAVVFAWNYFQGDRFNVVREGSYHIAQYARLRDYHKEMKVRAQAVLLELQSMIPHLSGRVTIDSAPILERALALRAGNGFIGKNTCYIDPKHGSFYLLGEILINTTLGEESKKESLIPKSRSEAGGCGTCKRCQVNCPTGALDKDYEIDARKCLSYWTIEHRGIIPKEFWPWVRLYIFGCDICQLVCPYNRSASVYAGPNRNGKLTDEEIFTMATMDQPTYEKVFGGSPMTRAKRDGLRRNALIAMHEAAHPKLNEALDKIDDDSEEVLIRTKEMILGKSAQGGT